MKRLATSTLLLSAALSTSACGFLENSRSCKFYLEHIGEPLWSDDRRVMLVTWPVLVPMHGTGLAVTATVDQTLRTGEVVVPASRDAADYFHMPVPDDNIMLHRTIVVPKLLGTPFVWLGSYIARWFAPISSKTRVFGSDDDPAEEQLPERQRGS